MRFPALVEMVRSDVWGAPDHARILWVTLLSLCDRNGVVAASVPGLARLASLPREQVEDALSALGGKEYGLLSHEVVDGRSQWRLHGIRQLEALEVRTANAKRQAAKRARDKAKAASNG